MSALNMPEDNRSFRASFAQLPQTLPELCALPEAALTEPYHAAALLIPALCLWTAARDTALSMLHFLKGPTPLSPMEIQFIHDRLRGKDYLPLSFFEGATPENGYAPSRPYTLIISENRYSYQEAGYAGLSLKSGGADSPRPVRLRQKPSTGQWFLWEQMLLSEIRPPAALPRESKNGFCGGPNAADPWA